MNLYFAFVDLEKAVDQVPRDFTWWPLRKLSVEVWLVKIMQSIFFFFFFINWYSLHARLNSHYEAWSYKKRKHKNVKAYRISI